jgi:hypothetical protein
MGKAIDEFALAGKVRKWLVAHHEFEQGDATKNDCHALIGNALGLCNSFVKFYNKWEPMVEADEDYRMTSQELIASYIFDHDCEDRVFPGLGEEDCMALGRDILSLIESRYLIMEGVTENG